jgi:hypothetical protein
LLIVDPKYSIHSASVSTPKSMMVFMILW